MITIDSKDLDRVEKALLRLSKASDDPKFITKVVKKPMREASKPILAAIKAGTSVKSGGLLASAKILINKPKKDEDEHFVPSSFIVSRIGYFWRGGQTGYKARAQEYGSPNNPPKAVLRESLERGFNEFVNTFRKGFIINVEKLIAKEFKKAGLKTRK